MQKHFLPQDKTIYRYVMQERLKKQNMEHAPLFQEMMKWCLSMTHCSGCCLWHFFDFMPNIGLGLTIITTVITFIAVQKYSQLWSRLLKHEIPKNIALSIVRVERKNVEPVSPGFPKALGISRWQHLENPAWTWKISRVGLGWCFDGKPRPFQDYR